MGVDSKVFVIAEEHRAQDVGEAVHEHLNKWQRKLLDEHVATTDYKNRFQFLHSEDNKDSNGRRLWSNGVSVVACSFRTFQFEFSVAGEQRCLWYHTNCSCDTDYITPAHTLLFSIGHWGLYKEIMQEVVDALKPFGFVFWDTNDCDDIDYELQNHTS